MSEAINKLKQAVENRLGDRQAEVIESFGILLVHHRSSRQFRWFDSWEDIARFYKIAY